MEIKIPGSYVFRFCHNIVYTFLTAARLAQWDKRRSAERRSRVQTPAGPTLRVFK